MVETYAVAVSPNRANLVLKRGEMHYAVINRKEGITKGTKWRDRKLLSSMRIKGEYDLLKKPIRYKDKEDKVEKGRKSVGRVDIEQDKKDKKKSKREKLMLDLGVQNFDGDLSRPYVKSVDLTIDLIKAGKAHLPKGAERNSYLVPNESGVIHIPVNRLEQVYQTDDALNPKKIKEIRKKMRRNVPLAPVEIGYSYDVHDGHHRWHAAMGEGYTHVPCLVVGTDDVKVRRAKRKYRQLFKSQTEDLNVIVNDWLTDFVDSLDTPVKEEPVFFKKGQLSLVIDLSKAEGTGKKLNTSKLVKRKVRVRGKHGDHFADRWVNPNDDDPNIIQPKKDDKESSTYQSHDEGIKEMERRQSTRFPIRHQHVENLTIREYKYRPDQDALSQAREDLLAGKKLPPIRINTDGSIISNHHLMYLAKEYGFSHIPVIVMGNPQLKRQAENELREKVYRENEQGEKEILVQGRNEPTTSAGESVTEEVTQTISDFKNFTIKKYPKKFLMEQAKANGISWVTSTKDGKDLPENSGILWMNAHKAIVQHISDGGSLIIKHDEKQVDLKMEQTGKDSIHKHFLRLLEKQGSKDALMDFARERGISWKEKKDPSINWLYAVMAIKKELASGTMLDGIRTRQKGAIADANLVVTDQIKAMVTAYGKQHGKGTMMETADSIGLEYAKENKKGEAYPTNSRILWMNAHQAISKYIAQGNEFKIGQDTGNSAVVGEYGGVTLTDVQGIAVNTGKRNSHIKEKSSRKWATKALMVDTGASQEEADELYETFRENARNAKLMVHFDPFELLPNGNMLLEQMSSENTFLNDFQLDRGMDRDGREVDERNLFGNDYDVATDEERPHYGVLDLFKQGLGSNPFDGEVALVLNDAVKERSTGIHMESSSIPYGEETNWTRSLEDPHHLIVDRWTSRWSEPKGADKQRERLMDSVISGNKSVEGDMFESQIHGGIDLSRDVEHMLVPNSWKSDSDKSDMHDSLVSFAEITGLKLMYEG